jgi:hypothetical protein
MIGREVRAVVLASVARRADVTAGGDGYDRHKDDHDEGFVGFHVHSHKNTLLKYFHDYEHGL